MLDKARWVFWMAVLTGLTSSHGGYIFSKPSLLIIFILCKSVAWRGTCFFSLAFVDMAPPYDNFGLAFYLNLLQCDIETHCYKVRLWGEFCIQDRQSKTNACFSQTYCLLDAWKIYFGFRNLLNTCWFKRFRAIIQCLKKLFLWFTIFQYHKT